MQGRLNSDQALKKLVDGNKRYISSKSMHPNQTQKRRIELKNGQNPFAVILGCSDSRVPPEVIFDQGLGDLFVVRVAGNITGGNVLASIEYAVAHLNTPLVVVLGHSDCGAIKSCASNAHFEGNLRDLISKLEPALEKARKIPGDLINNAAKINAKMVAEILSSSVSSGLVGTEALKVVAAYYDLDSGNVEFL